MDVVIPERAVILVAGIPATGKSTFCRHLASEHGFAHYDLEHHPEGWPRPNLKATWDNSRQQFIADLSKAHPVTVLDWGFPPACVEWVRELQTAGVRLIWFSGDRAYARRVFQARDSRPVSTFDAQVNAIQEAGLPGSLRHTLVDALTSDGTFLSCEDIEGLIFA